MPSGVLSSCRGDVEAIRFAHRLGMPTGSRMDAIYHAVGDDIAKCDHSLHGPY